MVERALLSDYSELLAFEERVFRVRFCGKVPKLYTDPAVCAEAHRVVKENGLECYLNEQTLELTVQTTLALPTHFRNWQAELLRQVQLVVRRLPANENFNKVINNLKKGGKK